MQETVAQVYEPPKAAPSPPPEDARPLNRQAYRALLFAFAPFFAAVPCLMLAGLLRGHALLIIVMAASVGLAIVGMWRGAKTGWRMLHASGWSASGLLAALAAIGLGFFNAWSGAAVALMALGGFTRGRQLRRRGRPLFAPLGADSTWLNETPAAPPIGPAEVAKAWRQNGLTEHASVAAFAKLSVELVALGAPPRLIEAAHQDALDEMRHTQLCFSLARDIDGRAVGPADFTAVSRSSTQRGPKTVRLAALAVESLVDGALNEGVSARVVAELSKTTTHSRIQPMLRIIARDEARHAAHGFDIVRWCVQAGGAPVVAALKGALRSLPEQPAALDYEMENAEAWGLPSNERLQRGYAETRRRLVDRTQRLIEENQ